MGEPTKKQENSLKNIGLIPSYEKKKMPTLQREIDVIKKNISDAIKNLHAKKELINKEIQDRLQREAERERLAKEKEEAIKIAVSMPIIEKAAEEEVAAKQVEETKEELSVQVEQQQEPVSTVEDTQVSDAEKERIKQENDLKASTEAILAPIFEKPKKPVIEKPVIRIYVPPADNNRPHRRNRDDNQQSTQPRTGGYQPRPAGQQQPFNRTTPSMPIPAPSSGGGNANRRRGDNRAGGAFSGGDNRRNMSKKALTRKGFLLDDTSAILYDESGEVRKVRSRKTSTKKSNFIQPASINIEKAVLNKEHTTIKELSEKIGKTGAEIIKQLFLLGIIKTINDTIDFDTAELVANELGVELELQLIETTEEKVMAYHDSEVEDSSEDMVTRPPIVTIMGHVDHGKTSILDSIRKADVAAGEAGGITQHIGAYSIALDGGDNITFLDTPGHEAFTSMRARGANVTDIAIIVVAADDGIMPQTIEAINHAKAANVNIIVAVNKMDKNSADPDRVLTQLTEHNLVPEDWGGTIPVVKVSAKTGMGIKDLLDTIMITAEIMELKANPNRKARGTIVEAKLDRGQGPVATVLVQNGTLEVGDFLVAGAVTGKVRAMRDSKGKMVSKAGPSTAVSILGLSEVPDAGDQIVVVDNERLMKQVASERQAREQQSRVSVARVSLDDVFKGIADGKLKNLNLIIKGDVQGSVEAIKDSLIKLSNEEVKVTVVHAVAGAINESDVMLADTTGSIIIGFNVRPDNNAKTLAEKNSIDIRIYRVIYDAIDDVQKAIKGLLAPKFREQYLGKAEVRVIYKISSLGTVSGCMVKDGKIVRNAKVRVLRDNIVVAETAISSLKRMKDDVREVASGYECGIGLENFNDVKEGDIIESFNLVQEE